MQASGRVLIIQMYTLDLAILSARTAGPYTTGNTRRMPALGWMGAACSRHEPRSHHLAGLLKVECER
jgi:hypothetical protein